MVLLSYSDKIKATNWYFPLGLFLATITNLLWLWIAKNSPNKADIYLRGLIWDSILVGCYVLVPLFLGVRLNLATSLGVILVVIGLILTKVG